MRVFTLVLTTGQIAAAMAAIGVLCLGLYKYMIQPARRIMKVYNSVGHNGKDTVFDLLHEIGDKCEVLMHWKSNVDQTLRNQNDTLEDQNNSMAAIGVAVEELMRRSKIS